MPITVMVSIGICGLFIAVMLFSMVVNIMAGDTGQAVGVIIRLVIDITIIKGLLERSNRIRWNGIVLDIIGLVFSFLCVGGAFMIGNDQIQQKAPGVSIAIVAVVFAIQAVFWIIDLVMLLSPSARDYCRE